MRLPLVQRVLRNLQRKRHELPERPIRTIDGQHSNEVRDLVLHVLLVLYDEDGRTSVWGQVLTLWPAPRVISTRGRKFVPHNTAATSRWLFIPTRERNEESIPTARFLTTFEMTEHRGFDCAKDDTNLRPDRRRSW